MQLVMVGLTVGFGGFQDMKGGRGVMNGQSVVKAHKPQTLGIYVSL